MTIDRDALPPAARSEVALGMAPFATEGRLALQCCSACRTVQYPPREACVNCLSSDLPWCVQDGAGELLSATVLHHSLLPYFQARLPWRVGLVRLDVGPTLITHLHAKVGDVPCRVSVQARIDQAGQPVLIACPVGDAWQMDDDPAMQDLCARGECVTQSGE